MKISKSMSRVRFAGAVVKQLEKDKVSAVLVGGSCISIYTNGRHQSKDLDFISPDSTETITESLAKIGFRREGRYYVHENSKFFVEFPTGPLTLGHDSSLKPQGRLKVDGTVVRMLSPTQSVMDRLAAFFHWNDRRSLIHALWVCEHQPINLTKLSAWAKKENSPDKFAEFLIAWKKIKKPRPTKLKRKKKTVKR